MNNSCDVIKDLLPLYHDGVCSEESNKFVKNHLETCNECRDYLDGISKEVLKYNNAKEEEAKIQALKKLRKKIRKKKIIVSIVSALCVVILFFAARNFILYHEFPVSYKNDIISSEKIDTASDILKNPDYHCAHVILKQADGKVTAYMYYTKTLWDDSPMGSYTRDYASYFDLFEYIDIDEFNKLSMEVSEDEQTQYIALKIATTELFYNSISAVYYFVGDYKKLTEMPDDEFFSATKDAVLIWEK
jgi:hypothetical protein